MNIIKGNPSTAGDRTFYFALTLLRQQSYRDTVSQLVDHYKEIIDTLEKKSGKTVAEYTVGKSSVGKAGEANVDPMNTATWNLKNIESRWTHYKRKNYDCLVVICATTDELTPKNIEGALCKQDYALMLKRSLIYHLKGSELTARSANKTRADGPKTTDVGILYVAFKYATPAPPPTVQNLPPTLRNVTGGLRDNTIWVNLKSLQNRSFPEACDILTEAITEVFNTMEPADLINAQVLSAPVHDVPKKLFNHMDRDTWHGEKVTSLIAQYKPEQYAYFVVLAVFTTDMIPVRLLQMGDTRTHYAQALRHELHTHFFLQGGRHKFTEEKALGAMESGRAAAVILCYYLSTDNA